MVRVYNDSFGRVTPGSGLYLREQECGGVAGKQILGSLAAAKHAVFIVVNRKVIDLLVEVIQAYLAHDPIREGYVAPVYIPSVCPDFSVEGNLGKLYRFVVFHAGNYSAGRIPVSTREKAVERLNNAIGKAIQTGAAGTKIKGYLKGIKGYCQTLKARFFCLFGRNAICLS
jgi:hypothetical protein